MVPNPATERLALADLRLFAKAVELSGLAAAARALGLPKSSATRQLQRLEAGLARRLVHRDGRHFALTEDGRTLLPHALQVIAHADEAVAALSFQDGPLTGTLRIAAPYTYGREVIGPTLPRFMAQHPALRVSLHLGSSHVDLLKDEADLAIRIGAAGQESLVARLLSREEFILCASPRYLAETSAIRRVKDLQQHRILDIRTDQGVTSLDLVNDSRRLRVPVTPVLRSNDPAILIQAACHHAGVGCVPLSLVSELLDQGTLVRVLPPWSMPVREVNALYARGRGKSPKVRAFLDFLVGEMVSQNASSAVSTSKIFGAEVPLTGSA